MSESATTPSVNGTLEDVAAFFRKSSRTVKRWVADRSIGYWKEGGCLMFPEDAVVEKLAGSYVSARRLQPGEAAEMARREWRAHLGQRGEWKAERGTVAELLRRLEAMEKRFSAEGERKAA